MKKYRYELTALLVFLVLTLEAQAYTKLRTSKTIYVDLPSMNSNQSWTKIANTPEKSIKVILDILAKSETGQKLLLHARLKAAKSGEGLSDILHAGKGSLTDTTLYRRFSSSDPLNVSFETKSNVYINENLSLVDAVLDTAHELTHYTFRTPFNPYKNDFTLADFIESTVEGVGGEVHAYLNECKVLYELFPSKVRAHYHCANIRDESDESFSREKAIKEFYKIGKYYEEFNQNVTKHKEKQALIYISRDEPLFISSAYGKPYPVAAYEEYFSVLSKACENEKNRISHLENSKQSRSLASLSDDSIKSVNSAGVSSNDPIVQKSIISFQDRCGKVQNN